MNLEALALARAEEQMEAGAWRHRDPDEKPTLAPTCAVCGEVIGNQRGGAKLCRPCRRQGWTASRCDCGAPLTRSDQKAKSAWRNKCRACRFGDHPEYDRRTSKGALAAMAAKGITVRAA